MTRAAYRTDIEGLRGVAILLVVLFHAGIAGFGGGFVGVDVFFVLSGYFITRPLVEEFVASGRIDVGEFYRRRAQRILPLLLVVLLFAVTLMTWLNAPIDRAAIAETVIPVAFGAGNIEFAASAVNYFSAGENALLHAWSLGVEQQFYLAWPLLLLLPALFRRLDLADGAAERLTQVVTVMWCAGAASLASAVWLTYASPAWAFFGLPTRLWEFALGGLVATLARPRADDETQGATNGRATQLAGMAAIVIAVSLFDRSTPYPGVAALLPALGAAAMLAAGGTTGSAIDRALSHASLQRLGRLSFAWYLWHWPLMVLGSVLSHDLGAAGRLAWGITTLGLAYATHHLVERPAREGRLVVRPEWTLTTYAAACGVLALLALGVQRQARRTSRSPEQRAFLLARNDRMKHDCWASSIRGPSGDCTFGDTNGARTIVLLGDSHAEHWLAGLDRAGRERGWRIVAMVRGGCPVAEMTGLRNEHLERRYRECAQYREGTIQRVIAMRPDAVLLSSYDHYIPFDIPVAAANSDWQVSDGEWQRGLRATYSRLAGAGLPLIAMRGTPRTWFDVPACLSRRAAWLPFSPPCTFDRSRAWSPRAVEAQTAAARGLPVQFLDMNDQICTDASCSVLRGDMIMYTDDNHLTASFTRSLAPVLGRRLESLLGAN